MGGITEDGCPLSGANFSGIFPDYKPSIWLVVKVTESNHDTSRTY
jgi:hypothetical protein